MTILWYYLLPMPMPMLWYIESVRFSTQWLYWENKFPLFQNTIGGKITIRIVAIFSRVIFFQGSIKRKPWTRSGRWLWKPHTKCGGVVRFEMMMNVIKNNDPNTWYHIKWGIEWRKTSFSACIGCSLCNDSDGIGKGKFLLEFSSLLQRLTLHHQVH